MFRNLPSVAQPATHTALPEPVLLSVLSLDLPVPGEGWASYLRGRNIPVGEDDLGLPAISRDDARVLIAEQRKAEQRKREALARQEQRAIEADRVKFAQIWKGVDADTLPVGVSAGDAMIAAAQSARPKRRSLVEETLSNSPTMEYHAYPPNPHEE
jgi:hypothetical protein